MGVCGVFIPASKSRFHSPPSVQSTNFKFNILHFVQIIELIGRRGFCKPLISYNIFLASKLAWILHNRIYKAANLEPLKKRAL